MEKYYKPVEKHIPGVGFIITITQCCIIRIIQCCMLTTLRESGIIIPGYRFIITIKQCCIILIIRPLIISNLGIVINYN